MNKKVGLLFFVVCLLANSAYAKRGPKPEVKPLHKGEYIYEEGSEGYYFDVDKSIFPEGYDFGVILVKST